MIAGFLQGFVKANVVNEGAFILVVGHIVVAEEVFTVPAKRVAKREPIYMVVIPFECTLNDTMDSEERNVRANFNTALNGRSRVV